jgi:hypothetical protein
VSAILALPWHNMWGKLEAGINIDMHDLTEDNIKCIVWHCPSKFGVAKSLML